MSHSPRISVVIPCYNVVRYISETLRSVLAQQGFDLEVIVVDDGSQDGSAELVERDFPQVIVLRQANQGASAARNAGIRRASSEWIAFVDSDDIWLPGKLQAQWRSLHSEPGARMCYTAWHTWESMSPEPAGAAYEALVAAADDPQRWQGPSGWIYPDLLLSSKVWTSTVVAHRSLFEEVGVFDTTMRLGEDYDLWLRASRVTPIVRVPRLYALYRMHAGNITRRVPAKNYQGEVLQLALDRWGIEGPDGRRADPAAVRRAMSRTWTNFAWDLMQARCLRRALAASLRAAWIDWRYVTAWKVMVRTVLCSLNPLPRSTS